MGSSRNACLTEGEQRHANARSQEYLKTPRTGEKTPSQSMQSINIFKYADFDVEDMVR